MAGQTAFYTYAADSRRWQRTTTAARDRNPGDRLRIPAVGKYFIIATAYDGNYSETTSGPFTAQFWNCWTTLWRCAAGAP